MIYFAIIFISKDMMRKYKSKYDTSLEFLRNYNVKFEVFYSYLFPLEESKMESIILLYFKRKLDSFNVLHEMINNALQFKNNTF